jgi:hypothetical protein
VDRIGDGSHPPSAGLDLTTGAVALHDAVTALRSGAVDGHPFQHVIIVGHSIGSVEAWIEAARYQAIARKASAPARRSRGGQSSGRALRRSRSPSRRHRIRARSMAA